MSHGTASPGFRTLVGLAPAELAARLRAGDTPDMAGLAGTEFRGANTAGWLQRLRLQQFVKGFARRTDGRLFGYNRLVSQDGRWQAPTKPFAFFEVRGVDPASPEHRYPQAVLLDYAAGGCPWWHPARPLRDYLVRVEARSDDLLLGRAFLAWGPFRPSPTYFVLEPLERTAPRCDPLG